MTPISNELWKEIRLRWVKGESAYGISKSLGCRPSKQAISQKAKREDWASLRQPGVLSDKHEQKTLVALGQDTPEARQAFLDALSRGVYQSIAAPACFGVTYQTVKNWRDGDLEFEMQVKSARARFAARHIENIDKWSEKDWKASRYLLETAPETKAEFGSSNSLGKLEVIVNINRDDSGHSNGVVIDGKINGVILTIFRIV